MRTLTLEPQVTSNARVRITARPIRGLLKGPTANYRAGTCSSIEATLGVNPIARSRALLSRAL